MNHGERLPDRHHIAVYLSGGLLIHPAPDSAGPTGIKAAAFVLPGDDDHHSGHHWEHVQPVPPDVDVMHRIRGEADGAGSDSIYARRPTGRYLRLNAEAIRSVGFGIDVKKLDGDYPSHSGICGMEKMKREDQLDLGKDLKGAADRLLPAVTEEQPRNDR